MAKAPQTASASERVVFELDRFELVGGDRCEVQGRWLGVRGRRFMRPALTVVFDGRSTRFLADLADKPWAAEDGEPWQAAFPWNPEAGHAADPELTVAPDITIPLPELGPPNGRTRKVSTGAGATAATRQRRSRAGAERTRIRAAREPAQRTERGQRPPQASSETLPRSAKTGPEQELAAAQAEQRRLQDQVDALNAAAAQAAARMAELMGDLNRLTREREQTREERDGVAAERDATRAAHDQALAARDEALASLDQALADRDQAATDRDQALADRDRALADREAALSAANQAHTARDSLTRTNERLQSELGQRAATRGAALVMRRAAQDRAVSRRNALPGVIAIVLLVALVVVLVLVLRVV